MEKKLAISNCISEKKQILDAILRKKVQIGQLIEKIEKLDAELLDVRTQFLHRVGKLYLEIDHLEREIVRYREIEELIRKGFSRDEAKNAVQAAEKRRENKKKTAWDDTVLMTGENVVEKDLNVMKEIKRLYRRLSIKFHPDLVQDVKEKKKREAMMKKVNTAYREKNIVQLQAMEEEMPIDNLESKSIEMLRKELERIINQLYCLEMRYEELIRSEWFVWARRLRKARRNNRDPFNDLEDKLEEDIRRRQILIQDLNNKYAQKQVNSKTE